MKSKLLTNEVLRKVFGKRVYAGITDLLIWAIIFIPAQLVFGSSRIVSHGNTKTQEYMLTGWPFAIFCLAAATYFIMLEWLIGGTLGKQLQGIRVVNEKGGRITLKQAIIRYILRIVDGFPYIFPFATGLIVMGSDKKTRRVGDIAAHTLVTFANTTELKKHSGKASSWSLPS